MNHGESPAPAGPADADLRATVRRLRQILDHSADAFIGMDAAGRVIEWNGLAAQLFGWSAREALGRSVAELIIPPDLRDAHIAGVNRLLATGVGTVLGIAQETRAMRRDGTEFEVELTRWRLDNGAAPEFYAFLRDISHQKQAEFASSHDALTGLNNRSSLVSRMEQLLHPDAPVIAGGAFALVDVDQFQRVNQRVGNRLGDEVLSQLAGRLARVSRPGDTIARLSGDQFGVLMIPPLLREELGRQLSLMADAVAEPIRASSHLLEVDASIGAAWIDTDRDDLVARDIETIWREAETALRQAKLATGTRAEIYDASARRIETARRGRADEIRSALERDEFDLHYQPIFRAPEWSIVGVEALLRWNHPEHGLLPPGEFVPVAEDYGLIDEVGRWVSRRVLTQIADWQRRQLLGTPPISINLSAAQLTSPEVIDDLFEVAAHLDIELSRGPLCVEVTEGVFIDRPERAAAVLRRLRDNGIRVALDDFGTGFSSLAYLKHLPLDVLKIDRTFVAGLPGGRADSAIATATISLADALDLGVVAEGVETVAQRDAVVGLGCRLIQGFLMGRPATVTALESRLGVAEPRHAGPAVP